MSAAGIAGAVFCWILFGLNCPRITQCNVDELKTTALVIFKRAHFSLKLFEARLNVNGYSTDWRESTSIFPHQTGSPHLEEIAAHCP